MTTDYFDTGELYDFQFSAPPSSDSVDMAGFYTPSPFETSSNDLTYDIQSTNNESPSVFNYTLPKASEWDLSKTLDYGVKLGNTLVDSYGKIIGIQAKAQDAEFSQYLKGAQIDIMKTQVASQADVAKVRAETDFNIAKIKANAAGTASILAQAGGTSNSVMLYLTIAGLMLAFMQVVKK